MKRFLKRLIASPFVEAQNNLPEVLGYLVQLTVLLTVFALLGLFCSNS